jgi:predicted Zn-dependent peptidase
MKNIIIALSIVCASANTMIAQTLDRSIRPKAGPAPEVRMGDAQSFVTANGIQVFVVENHKLPMVSYSLDFDTRPALQGNMTGMQDMIGELLTSGTKSKSKDEFNKQLDMLGATLSVASNGLYLQSLKKNSDKLLALASEMILQPNFTQVELDKLKKQMKSGLASQLDDPEAMSKNISKTLNYGKKHPYGEMMTEKTIDAITLDACKKHYATYFKPNVSYLAIVGDITLAEAKAQTEKYFGKWAKGVVPRTPYITPKQPNGATVAIVNKTSAVQSVIDVTYPINIKQGNADVVKLKVANGILGGGATGRLFQNLRETHGWTYGSYSSTQEDELEYGGSFSATANAKTAATDSSIAEILKEMNRLRTEPVSKEELEGYKNYMAGTFALGLEDPKRLAQFAINTAKFKMPKDYYKNYLKSIDAVTANDVMEVTRKYINPGIATITVAGDKETTIEKLKKFGPVTEYDFYGDVQKPTNTKASAMAMKLSAKEVIEKYINAVGGADKWKGVKDLTQKMSMEMQGQKITVEVVKKAPNKSFEKVGMMGMVLQKKVFDGEKGYMEMQGQKKDMTEKEIAEEKDGGAMLDELDFLNPSYKLTLKGVEKVDGKDCYVLEAIGANNNGKKSTNYYEVESGLKVKELNTEPNDQGVTVVTNNFKDYKTTKDGLKYPSMINTKAGPQVMDLKVETFDSNTGVGDDVFK